MRHNKEETRWAFFGLTIGVVWVLILCTFVYKTVDSWAEQKHQPGDVVELKHFNHKGMVSEANCGSDCYYEVRVSPAETAYVHQDELK